jgi:hypothetical protein
MLKLRKAQIAERDKMVADLRTNGETLAAAITALNEGMAPLCQAVEEAMNVYNESLDVVREFVGEIASDARSEFDDHTEHWQDSAKGEAADKFIKAWEEIELEDLDIEIPEQLEAIDSSEHAVPLEELPDSPSEE